MKAVGIFNLLLLLLPVASGQTTECRPGENCQPPDCRCWNDETVPGNIATADTPQVVLVTFEYAVNSGNIDRYTGLFDKTVNPNNCPAVGTFFVQEADTDFSLVKGLADNGNEIGVTSVNGTLPETEQEWRDNIATVRDRVVAAGISQQRVLGVRAPQLQPGGLNEFTALSQENLLYDASCTTSRFDDRSSFRWPYTYDFAPGPACDNGEGPEQLFPGKWQLLIADLEFNGTRCATPSACTNIATQRDAFDLLYNSFIKHYEGNKTPFMLVINPQWVTVDFKREGTRQFIEYVRAAFDDTWFLSVTQSLEWVRQPVPTVNATDYAPWGCATATELYKHP